MLPGWETEPTWGSLTRSPAGSDRLLRRRSLLTFHALQQDDSSVGIRTASSRTGLRGSLAWDAAQIQARIDTGSVTIETAGEPKIMINDK